MKNKKYNYSNFIKIMTKERNDKRMNKKLKRLYAKFVILILCLLILIRIVVLVLSKYESIANSTANVDIAFYLLNEDYKTMTLNLASLFPQDDAYVYTFSIGNQDGEKTAEIDLVYDLTIRTTTNLPLTYELYKNQKHTDNGAVNIIETNTVDPDEYGTYFRNMTTQEENLYYKEPKTNIYELVIHFPENYNTINYQNIIEALEIQVDSHQVTS